MTKEANLYQLNILNNLLITSADMGPDKEAEFAKSIKRDKLKMLLVDNRIACVMIAPEVYTAFMEMSEQVLKDQGIVPSKAN